MRSRCAVSGMKIEVNLPNAQANSAIIISKHENGALQAQRCYPAGSFCTQLHLQRGYETYPVGSARLLNGGDFAGGETNSSDDEGAGPVNPDDGPQNP